MKLLLQQFFFILITSMASICFASSSSNVGVTAAVRNVPLALPTGTVPDSFTAEKYCCSAYLDYSKQIFIQIGVAMGGGYTPDPASGGNNQGCPAGYLMVGTQVAINDPTQFASTGYTGANINRILCAPIRQSCHWIPVTSTTVTSDKTSTTTGASKVGSSTDPVYNKYVNGLYNRCD